MGNNAAPKASAFSGSFQAPKIVKFWSAYSIFVSLAKFLLPLSALALVGYFVIWPQLEAEVKQTLKFGDSALLENIPDTFSALNPEFLGLDDNNQPYTLSADLAEQSRDRESEIFLTSPKADLNMNDGTWLALTAENGLYDKVQRLLNLNGNVEIFQNEGFTIQTTDANFDLPGGYAYGQTPVTGHGPAGQIESEGFEIERKGEVIRFTGAAELIILPGEGKGLTK
ncbi:LPS export ABC transporter periplasmic protein LptC [Kiloniella sp. b19]|uniref:LPS export ABC transporter periplasmic protein LptC n=1 Tax=Kiloniella sp. GXU_MW_B19 TaxID=3141326 RepID=UPI0031D7DF5F